MTSLWSASSALSACTSASSDLSARFLDSVIADIIAVGTAVGGFAVAGYTDAFFVVGGTGPDADCKCAQ